MALLAVGFGYLVYEFGRIQANYNIVEVAKERGMAEVELHSQIHAIPFYDQLGFCAVGEIFDEAGAPHRRMVLELS